MRSRLYTFSRWLAPRLALAILIPGILLALMEGGLRLFGIGYPTDFLIPEEVNGEAVWVENPFYTYQVFTPPLARVPDQIVATQDKHPEAFRLVVLGESAAQGDPLPAFGPARMLEYTLRHHDPSARIEVFNAAITAINSHLIRDLARELPKLQPDVVILYMGNNEVIGPFGPGTVFSRFVNLDVAIRISAVLQKLRMTQLIRFATFMVSDDRDGQTFEGVRMFMEHPVRHDDPRLQAVRRRYEQNLQSIIQSAHRSGAHVLLSTVAVNITDCPPSISTHAPDLSAADETRWSEWVVQGQHHAQQQHWPDAVKAFSEAADLDDTHAELQYWLGVCWDRAGDRQQAAVHFERALEFDAFRYRTDAALNEIIRQTAAGYPESTTLVEADRLFRQHPQYTDAELFVDHVHFSFTGTAHLAGLWAQAILDGGGNGPVRDQQGPPSEAWLREELLYSEVAEFGVLQEMRTRFSRPPFSRQLNSEARIQELNQRLSALDARMREGVAEHRLDEVFADRVERYPDDLQFRMHWAVHLLGVQRYAAARSVLLEAKARHPHRRGPRTLLAQVDAVMGQPQAAAAGLFPPGPSQGYFTVMASRYLMDQLCKAGHFREAAQVCEAILEVIRPIDFSWQVRRQGERAAQLATWYEASGRSMDMGQWDQAEEPLLALLRDYPHAGEAAYRLAVIDLKRGRSQQAFARATEALKMMSFARAQYHAGLWQLQRGNLVAAQDHFQRATERAHDDVPLVTSLALLYWKYPMVRAIGVPSALNLIDPLADRIETPPAELLSTQAWLRESKQGWPPGIRPMNYW